MVRHFFYFAATLACAAFGGGFSPALAQSRMALVIGNSAYQTVTALTNPSHDAQAVAQILNAAGFDVVLALDLPLATMQQTIHDFGVSVSEKGPDNIALVFYAGHGLQIDGENFLVPIDASIKQEGDVTANTLPMAALMETLQAVPSAARIVILDACRNNPFTSIQKTTGRGLAVVDAPNGSIVAYSTAPGTEALDGTGNDSPYTTALVDTVKAPGLPIEQLFKEIRLRVHKATDGKQTPWETSSLSVNFAFFANLAAALQPNNTTIARPAQPVTTTNQPGNAVSQPVTAVNQPVNAVSQPVVGTTPTPISHSDANSDKAARIARIRTLPPADAYDYVIEEDSVDAYQDFIDIYSSDPLCDRIRRILFRREQMLAWRNATLTNTPDAYESYIQRYPYSDHIATANRLHIDPRPVSIDPIIAPHNFSFPHFPGQFGPPQFGGSQRSNQNGPVVLNPSQGGNFPGKPGGSNNGNQQGGPTGNQQGGPTGNQQGGSGSIVHLPGGVILDPSKIANIGIQGGFGSNRTPGGNNPDPTKIVTTTPGGSNTGGSPIKGPGGINLDPTKTVTNNGPNGSNTGGSPIKTPGGITLDPTKTVTTTPGGSNTGGSPIKGPGGINLDPTKTVTTTLNGPNTGGSPIKTPGGVTLDPSKTVTTIPGGPNASGSPIKTPGGTTLDPTKTLTPGTTTIGTVTHLPGAPTNLGATTTLNPTATTTLNPTKTITTPTNPNPPTSGGGGTVTHLPAGTTNPTTITTLNPTKTITTPTNPATITTLNPTKTITTPTNSNPPPSFGSGRQPTSAIVTPPNPITSTKLDTVKNLSGGPTNSGSGNQGSTKSPVITPSSSVDHFPAVVTHTPAINTLSAANTTHFPPASNINPVRNTSTPTFSQVTKTQQPSFSQPARSSGGGGFGGGGGGGGGGKR